MNMNKSKDTTGKEKSEEKFEGINSKDIDPKISKFEQASEEINFQKKIPKKT